MKSKKDAVIDCIDTLKIGHNTTLPLEIGNRSYLGSGILGVFCATLETI